MQIDDYQLKDFPSVTFDKIRYGDTDRQGHVNNAVFSAFLETGRVELLYDPDFPKLSDDTSFVIVSLNLVFISEINWPGRVDIGTGVLKIGSSSIMIFQKLFQNDVLVASAETVIVQVNHVEKRSTPLSEKARASLEKWLLTQSSDK